MARHDGWEGDGGTWLPLRAEDERSNGTGDRCKGNSGGGGDDRSNGNRSKVTGDSSNCTSDSRDGWRGHVAPS